MKRVCIALCPRCGFVWNTVTRLVLAKEAYCPGGCGIPGVIRINPSAPSR
jgi:hypothetical protein